LKLKYDEPPSSFAFNFSLRRYEKARAAAAAAAAPPPLLVTHLTDAARAELELGCDEMHFLPVPDSGWQGTLVRYEQTFRMS